MVLRENKGLEFEPEEELEFYSNLEVRIFQILMLDYFKLALGEHCSWKEKKQVLCNCSFPAGFIFNLP